MELANGQLTLSITIALSLGRLLLTFIYSQILIVTSIVHFHIAPICHTECLENERIKYDDLPIYQPNIAITDNIIEPL